MNLAENLKKIRKENNLSQEQLAEQLGVSRQSVSKWESGQAYPEMDKVLQMAKMFNLNIDDLLNQDIKEVNNEKQSKLVINKYIEDFLLFITKTIDMFSSMKWKTKIKCLFEQLVIGCILLVLFLIIGDVVHYITYGFISIFPSSIQSVICSISGSIYLIVSLILGLILIIHIFKVRYLDYYVIVKEESNSKDEKENKEDLVKEHDNQKIYLEKKKEKIIIRDPKHTGYRFISGMLKSILFLVKVFVLIIAFTFCISLVCLVLSFILSFLFIKTGLFFFGLLLTLLACIFINIIVLIILFNFIINKKNNKKYLLISFISSIVFFGIGVGISVLGIINFNYIDDIKNDVYIESEQIIPMQDNLIIHGLFDIEYIEENRSDIKVVYKHTEFFDPDIHNYDNNVYLDTIISNNNYLGFYRNVIKDINNKKIINYSKSKIYVYTSKENIDKLNNNWNNYIRQEEEENDYYNMIEEENNRYEQKIYELENKIETLQSQLDLYQ